jgi:hypothetical protein
VGLINQAPTQDESSLYRKRILIKDENPVITKI